MICSLRERQRVGGQRDIITERLERKEAQSETERQQKGLSGCYNKIQVCRETQLGPSLICDLFTCMNLSHLLPATWSLLQVFNLETMNAEQRRLFQQHRQRTSSWTKRPDPAVETQNLMSQTFELRTWSSQIMCAGNRWSFWWPRCSVDWWQSHDNGQPSLSLDTYPFLFWPQRRSVYVGITNPLIPTLLWEGPDHKVLKMKKGETA